MISFNDQQIEKLSDLFMDLGKGLFVLVFTVSVIKEIDFIVFLKYLLSGIICAYFSLKLLELKGKRI